MSCFLCAHAGAAVLDDVGFSALSSEQGDALPTGSGSAVTMVEADSTGNEDLPVAYLPNPTSAGLAGKSLIDESQDPDADNSSHATMVANRLVGLSESMTPGTEEVHVYFASNWLQDGFLNFGVEAPPLSAPNRFLNHSWIVSLDEDSHNIDVLRRIDYAIQEQDLLMVGGVNNGANNALPRIIGHSYNAVTVGRSDGQHSAAITDFYGDGRQRPHIVAPAASTSAATPYVASAGHLLSIGAEENGLSQATDSRVIRALLYAGASQQSLPIWERTDTLPLDPVYGTGELNIYNSYSALLAGQFQPGSEDNSGAGWDLNSISRREPKAYAFSVPEGWLLRDFNAALVWNLDVYYDPRLPRLDNFSTSLADLSLRLYDTVQGANALLQASLSEADNLEYIHLPGVIFPGQYTLEVESAERANTEYALAWFAPLDVPRFYDEWAYFAFQSDATAAIEPLLDPDGDGVVNLIEYASGMNPLAADADRLPSGENVTIEPNGSLSYDFSYFRRASARDLTYAVGISTDLANWDFSESTLQVVSIDPIDDDFEKVTVRHVAQPGAAAIFMQLEIEEIEGL